FRRSNFMGYSLFQSSTLGMMSQAHALNTIGSNIANVSTGGFKRTETRFETVLSNTIRTGAGADGAVSFASPESAFGGVNPKDYQIIDQQGIVIGTARDLDLAIVGDGFFQVSPDLQVSGQIFYTRDGSFEINVAGATTTSTDSSGNTFTIQEGYLADKNGQFLLGVAADVNGQFTSTTSAPMRVDQFAFANTFRATTAANIGFNLPSLKQFGESSETFALQIIDSNGARRTVTFSLAKKLTANQWQMDVSGDNLTTSSISPGAALSVSTGPTTGKILVIDQTTRKISVNNETLQTSSVPGTFQGLKVGDSITIAGSAAGNNNTFTITAIASDFSNVTVAATPALTSETITGTASVTSTQSVANPLIFGSDGSLQSPTSVTVALTWSDGATNSFTLDMSTATQFNGVFTIFNSGQNGLGKSNLKQVSFDAAGHVIGEFEDGTSRKIYKVPLATFVNANGLDTKNGNLFAESPLSGPARVVFADQSGIAILSPNAVEISNVDLASEFTQMIRVQQAYNSSATVFRTVDEMTIVARDLKA
ncbi:MAG: flagellar hook-basal body complex protein, partial [Rhodospirillales bacterium]